MKTRWDKRIFVSITGKTNREWKSKIQEINKLKIKEVALFLSQFTKNQRREIYKHLRKSCIKKIPLVHARTDMSLDEFEFLIKNFKVKYFNIHEYNFPLKKEWKPIYDKLLLEMNYDNHLNKKINLNKIGGFCIDLSHFKASEERWTKDFLYVLRYHKMKVFKANHLNGYSNKYKRDIHKPKSKSDFQYLKTLPKFIFGKVIALEMQIPIHKQLEFREEIIHILNEK